ncbi:hypothetical protein [Salinilacihabitans rarus]|uniref:hypothetical protein n=1 Tax=Salinilacihabitans rarus TaxID=2961596 RepID=UPI0020C90FB0|nr:hypothetical protein [Salinilacihabitans rarus]
MQSQSRHLHSETASEVAAADVDPPTGGSRVLYELVFELDDDLGDRHGERISDAVFQCLSADGVQGLWAYQTANDDRPRNRLTLEFDDAASWAEFSLSDAHRDLVATLEVLCRSVRTDLWAPAGVSLSGGGPPIVGLE